MDLLDNHSDYLSCLLSRMKEFRVQSGLSREQAEEKLILGPGWIEAMETGKTSPRIDVIASVLSLYQKDLSDLTEGITGAMPQIDRSIHAEDVGGKLEIHFTYSRHDAVYELAGASLKQYTEVISTLRNGLTQLRNRQRNPETVKTESVADAFLTAVRLWPSANPSDLWWFLIYRAYCDQYNHPSDFSRMDFSQSWKRTGGWALERILERHYGKTLLAHGINLVIARDERKRRLLACLDISARLEAAKMDVLLTVGHGSDEKLIGVVHVKASFAERRTDDVPMSQALVEAGYISPLWTMDCKSAPSPRPVNRGELGRVFRGNGSDRRSAKRKDIEDDGYFSACFSYNKNTRPTPAEYDARAKVVVCDFSSPNDAFVDFIVTERARVKKDIGI